MLMKSRDSPTVPSSGSRTRVFIQTLNDHSPINGLLHLLPFVSGSRSNLKVVGSATLRPQGPSLGGSLQSASMTDSNRPAASALGFGAGISTDHLDGIRWVDYANISWNPVFCKRCDICIEICPKNTLVLRNDVILEEENCILCGLCERYCPDVAIEMIPEAVAAHAAGGSTSSTGEPA